MRSKRDPDPTYAAVAVLLALQAACWVPGAAAAAADPAAQALIDRVLVAYGGWPKLSAVSSYRMQGALITGHDKSPIPTERIFSRPGRLKIVITHPERAEVRYIDGDRGWRTAPKGGTEPASGAMLDAMVLQRARAALPWLLADRRDEVRLLALDTPDSDGLAGLEVRLGEGLLLRAFVDRRTHQVTRVITQLDRGGMSIAFAARYSDFRPVSGVLFPFREENFTGGSLVASTAFDTITLNPPLSDRDFLP